MDELLILWSGIKVGFVLAIMVGPLAISLLYTSVENGKASGLLVGIGIWLSDLLFITIVYNMFQKIKTITEYPYFEETLGIGGSIILLGIGLGIMLKRPETMRKGSSIKAKDFFGFLVQGFSINSFNPFTFVFWITVMGAVVIKNNYNTTEAFIYFGGILLTIVVTDSLKVLFAGKLSKWFTPYRLNKARLYSGAALILFGVILAYRVLIY